MSFAFFLNMQGRPLLKFFEQLYFSLRPVGYLLKVIVTIQAVHATFTPDPEMWCMFSFIWKMGCRETDNGDYDLHT